MKKLKKILLINWLYFSKQVIEVGDINFLTGSNGAGKSTIIDALQIVLLGETSARNFNQAANERSQRTLEGYLFADMDANNPYSRQGKDFSSYIACEFWDEIEGTCFVTGIVFDCRSDRSRPNHYFIYDGKIPENCFIQDGEAMDVSTLRVFLRKNFGVFQKVYETNTAYRNDMIAKWNVHTEQILKTMKRAVSFRPVVDIQKFITDYICDIPNKPNIIEMQQNIRDYKRHELLAQRQEEKLAALQEIAKLYREMNLATDRWRQHFFLAQWGEQEELKEIIGRREQDMEECKEEIREAEKNFEEISRQIREKEQQKEERTAAYHRSDAYKEEDRLEKEKRGLLQEQSSLVGQLQKTAADIRQEAVRLSGLCQDMEDWPTEEVLLPLLDAAVALKRSYAPFCDCQYQIFAKSPTLFEKAQTTIASFSGAVRDGAYQVERLLSNLKTEQDQKKGVLGNLRRNIKDYPKRLLSLKERLASGLKTLLGHSVQIDILADVLEIPNAQEQWRGAIEGYLNTQKFYLIVPPEHYQKALELYDKIKEEYSAGSFGLVDVGKLREREQLHPQKNSLAQKIETENDLARSYVDYLLGQVICCTHADQLRQYRTAITAEGMLYQGYVARPLRRELMENTFIGRQAVQLRISRLEKELREVQEAIQYWTPFYDVLSKQKDREPLLTPYFVQNDVQARQTDYLRTLEITGELKKVEEELSHLNLFWLKEQEELIETLKKEIEALHGKKEQTSSDKGRLAEKLHRLEYDDLPKHCQALYQVEERLADDFTPEFIETIGKPRYQQELTRLKKPGIVRKNFSDQVGRTLNEQRSAQQKLFQTRANYAERFKPCSFSVEAMNNDEFAAEQERLEKSELPRYREKIKASRESAIEQFKSDFLDKLRSSIEQVQSQVKDLNRSLRQTQFGTDSYQFRVDRNPDYAEYYDMITAPESMDGDKGLFAIPFQQKYGALMEELFGRIAMADDTQLNARKQTELQENIERYTDFRTYLKFDLETTDQNGSKQLLSQTLNTKSGGETQTPFYIAMLASFAQLYQVNNLSGLANNTVRLVVFDEAFNKMDSDRIIESVRLLRKLGLQAIICTPPEKAQDIAPIADRTFVVSKNKYQMCALPFGKETDGEWIRM